MHPTTHPHTRRRVAAGLSVLAVTSTALLSVSIAPDAAHAAPPRTPSMRAFDISAEAPYFEVTQTGLSQEEAEAPRRAGRHLRRRARRGRQLLVRRRRSSRTSCPAGPARRAATRTAAPCVPRLVDLEALRATEVIGNDKALELARELLPAPEGFGVRPGGLAHQRRDLDPAAEGPRDRAGRHRGLLPPHPRRRSRRRPRRQEPHRLRRRRPGRLADRHAAERRAGRLRRHHQRRGRPVRVPAALRPQGRPGHAAPGLQRPGAGRRLGQAAAARLRLPARQRRPGRRLVAHRPARAGLARPRAAAGGRRRARRRQGDRSGQDPGRRRAVRHRLELAHRRALADRRPGRATRSRAAPAPSPRCSPSRSPTPTASRRRRRSP